MAMSKKSKEKEINDKISDKVFVLFTGLEATNRELSTLMNLLRQSHKYANTIQDCPAAVEAMKKAQEHLKNRIRDLLNDEPHQQMSCICMSPLISKLAKLCLPCFAFEEQEQEHHPPLLANPIRRRDQEEEEYPLLERKTKRRKRRRRTRRRPTSPLNIPFSDVERFPMSSSIPGDKNIVDWFKECNPSDQDWESISALKERVIELGTMLFYFLVDFVLLIPVPHRESFMEKTETFRFNLEAVQEDGKLVVVNRMMNLLDEPELKNIGKKEFAGEDERRNWKDFCERVGDELLNEIAHLEIILTVRALPELPILTQGAMLYLEDCFDTFDRELRTTDEAVAKQMTQSSSLGLQLRDHLSKTNALRRQLELKIQQLWNDLGSEEIQD